MEECRRCVSRETHYAVSLEASLQRQVRGWGSGGAATETEVRHHPTRAATTTVVTMVVTLGSLSPNSHLREVVELPARRRKSGKPVQLRGWKVGYQLHRSSHAGQINNPTIPGELLPEAFCLLSLCQTSMEDSQQALSRKKHFLGSDVDSRVPLNFVQRVRWNDRR